MPRMNYYAYGGLDRAAALRQREEWLEHTLMEPETRLVPIWRNRNLVAEGDEPKPVLLEPEAARALMDGKRHTALLGVRDGVTYIALDVSDLDEEEAQRRIALAGPRANFVDLRAVGPLMVREEGSLLAYARGLMYWHLRHRFCGLCGHPTLAKKAGHVLKCSNPDCATEHFPRTDPAVIMLVEHEGKALLGRSPRFAEGMYSTLAGFVEPGESLEEAVAREVEEEAGVKISNVRYHSSQPWPFPSSIMLGFYATAETTDITIDREELADARWFSRAEMRDFDGVNQRLPRADSIARRLIEDWLAEDA
ncbi:NAD(+) diphosphatase [Oceanibaculum nanhaiense]|jgi:NAD+ diphosphatase|uniref:NAD(+) diphosphatase n=1 Tax=Oceanibaculum nanhaiense TaxID=1909734 RepID=UPI000A372FE7|nr:NAD(+) diphosphatase [Oceanibaculum nanhaiense]MBC7135080.1 NAD(+) diphosphatase [Oceanibaculum nanhaiense]